MATATKRFSFQVTEGRLVIQVGLLRHGMKCLPKLTYVFFCLSYVAALFICDTFVHNKRDF